MERNRKQYKGKKWLKFRHIYAMIMIGVTLYFAWSVFDLLVMEPNRSRGIPAHGYRMENIQALEESWITSTENFGATLNLVDYVSIFWNEGPVVYVSVRVHPGTDLSEAQSAATDVVEYFIAVSNDAARQYDIQIVLSHGDVAKQRVENQEAVVWHVHEYNHSFAEATLSHAEQYPNQSNFHRAYTNINVRFTNSIRVVVGEDGLAGMRARLDVIEIMDEVEGYEDIYDDEVEREPMPSYSGVHQIPPSNITDFPIWGAWCNDRSRIRWNNRDETIPRPGTLPDDECLYDDDCLNEDETETETETD